VAATYGVPTLGVGTHAVTLSVVGGLTASEGSGVTAFGGLGPGVAPFDASSSAADDVRA
jgi:hypothetical protein